MLVIFGVYAFTFGFANLLKNHLFRHLRRDASQANGRFLELDFLLELRVRLDFASFIQVISRPGFSMASDDLFHGKDIDLAGFRIDPPA